MNLTEQSKFAVPYLYLTRSSFRILILNDASALANTEAS